MALPSRLESAPALDTRLQFGVVGCGAIGKRHLAVVTADRETSLVAMCEIDREKHEELARLYPRVTIYDKFETFLQHPGLDVVAICTPHGLHAPMAIAALKAGRHVLVEKPMALSVTAAQSMIAAAKETERCLMVVKQNRYNVPIALAKTAIDQGHLGRLMMIKADVLWNRRQEYYSGSSWRGRRLLEGGSLFTQVSHFIDLLVWWCGDIIEARTLTTTANHRIEIEDNGAAALRFSSGTLGSLAWTTCVYRKNYEGSITIIGEKGTIKIGGEYLNKIEFWDVENYPMPEGIEFVDQPNAYGTYKGSSSNHDKVIQDVAARLLRERVNVVEGDEGIRTIQAIEKIYDACGYPRRESA
jgi:UDP-N-acetyl-2-amino-2-deoxyglucuronate dehydrogenase